MSTHYMNTHKGPVYMVVAQYILSVTVLLLPSYICLPSSWVIEVEAITQSSENKGRASLE